MLLIAWCFGARKRAAFDVHSPLQRRAGGGKARRVAGMDAGQFGVSPWMGCRQTPEPDRVLSGRHARKARKRGGLLLGDVLSGHARESYSRSEGARKLFKSRIRLTYGRLNFGRGGPERKTVFRSIVSNTIEARSSGFALDDPQAPTLQVQPDHLVAQERSPKKVSGTNGAYLSSSSSRMRGSSAFGDPPTAEVTEFLPSQERRKSSTFRLRKCHSCQGQFPPWLMSCRWPGGVILA